MSADATVNVGELRQLIEKVERLEEDIRDLNADKSDVFRHAKGQGYDVRAMKAVIAKRRLDSAEREERESIFDLYWTALHGGSR